MVDELSPLIPQKKIFSHQLWTLMILHVLVDNLECHAKWSRPRKVGYSNGYSYPILKTTSEVTVLLSPRQRNGNIISPHA